MSNKIKDALIGLAIGDALGVPVEFKNRNYFKAKPVKTMLGYGTHNQPAGTWSDDSSLTFCLADSLSNGYNISDIAKKFIQWRTNALWTAHGQVFDIGNTTNIAIQNLIKGITPENAGPNDEYSNGNGSLMRILPLAFYLKNKNIEERFNCISQVSSITHGHIRSVLSCFIYIEYAILLLAENQKFTAYSKMQEVVNKFLDKQNISYTERDFFSKILTAKIETYSENEIRGSGYVIHSLESSLWCILNNKTFSDTVLTAVNLGEDTDTTAAITGGLAGIIYGISSIPQIWLSKLARFSDIEKLAEKYNNSLK